MPMAMHMAMPMAMPVAILKALGNTYFAAQRADLLATVDFWILRRRFASRRRVVARGADFPAKIKIKPRGAANCSILELAASVRLSRSRSVARRRRVA